jgi:general secretion pathway protein A
MYCDFYGLTEKPFNMTPDPKFLYRSASHREALAALTYGIRERSGFIAMLGEVGTGKTTLINVALEGLDSGTRVAGVFCPFLPSEDRLNIDMLNMLLVDLGLTERETPLRMGEGVQRFQSFALEQFGEGKNVVLFVDEAQKLDPAALESLRLLSNLETKKRKLIQVVLSGQPELDLNLRQPCLRQVAQRIAIRRDIRPLSREETQEYMVHRLGIAGYRGRRLFDRGAVGAVWEFAQGVPRAINVVCDNALVGAYALGRRTIDKSIISEVVQDLRGVGGGGTARKRGAKVKVSATAGTRGFFDVRRVFPGTRRVFPSLSMVMGFVGITVGVVAGTGMVPGAGVSHVSSIRDDVQAGLTQHPTRAPVPGLWDQGERQSEWSVASGTVMAASAGKTPRSAPSKSSVSGRAGPERRNLRQAEGLIPGGAGSANGQEVRLATVQTADSLSSIIARAYGRYGPHLQNEVLRANPQLRDPDRIKPGQVIKLPKR